MIARVHKGLQGDYKGIQGFTVGCKGMVFRGL